MLAALGIAIPAVAGVAKGADRRAGQERIFLAGRESASILPPDSKALHLIQRGYLGARLFFTHETCWYLGAARTFRGDALPFGGFTGPFSFTIEMTGGGSRLQSQLELEPHGSVHPFTHVTAQAVLDAIGPVCASSPGVVIHDPRPRYRLDDRFSS